jgi:CRISPR/Cas system CSM-associated protein Csm3 (group 7 of RAMP superfamily)
MIVAGSSNSIFKVEARVTTGTLQTTTMEITLWNTSQRAYDEATTGTTAPVRIKHSVAFNHTSTYANPWGFMTVPPGTYFISVKHYSNLDGVANLRFTLT